LFFVENGLSFKGPFWKNPVRLLMMNELDYEIENCTDPTKLFFFANEKNFNFLLVSLRVYYMQKKIIDIVK